MNIDLPELLISKWLLYSKIQKLLVLNVIADQNVKIQGFTVKHTQGGIICLWHKMMSSTNKISFMNMSSPSPCRQFM